MRLILIAFYHRTRTVRVRYFWHNICTMGYAYVIPEENIRSHLGRHGTGSGKLYLVITYLINFIFLAARRDWPGGTARMRACYWCFALCEDIRMQCMLFWRYLNAVIAQRWKMPCSWKNCWISIFTKWHRRRPDNMRFLAHV